MLTSFKLLFNWFAAFKFYNSFSYFPAFTVKSKCDPNAIPIQPYTSMTKEIIIFFYFNFFCAIYSSGDS